MRRLQNLLNGVGFRTLGRTPFWALWRCWVGCRFVPPPVRPPVHPPSVPTLCVRACVRACVRVCVRAQRSSISLVVIIVEGTGKIDYLLPIILTTVCAKWVGDKLNDGFYHTALRIKGIPFLDSEHTRGLQHITAKDMMSPNPQVVQAVSTVAEVIDILQQCDHDGFPVVDHRDAGGGHMVEVFCGTILRSSLGVLIDQRRFYKEVPTEEEDGGKRLTSTMCGGTQLSDR